MVWCLFLHGRISRVKPIGREVAVVDMGEERGVYPREGAGDVLGLLCVPQGATAPGPD